MRSKEVGEENVSRETFVPFPGGGEATDALIDGIQGEGTAFLLCVL